MAAPSLERCKYCGSPALAPHLDSCPKKQVASVTQDAFRAAVKSALRVLRGGGKSSRS
jgi:hypothetical protein